MIGLEKITTKIIADAEADAAKTIADAEARCAEITAEYNERAEKTAAAMQSDAEHEATDIISRAKSTAAMEKRNILLSEKSRIVDSAFEEARERVLSLSPEKYLELLGTLTISAWMDQIETERRNRELYGETDMPDVEKYEVVLNKIDREKYGTGLVKYVRFSVKGKINGDIAAKLVLSDEIADIDGGVILRYGDVESNCSLSMLFASMRNEIEAEVCRVLFG